MRYTLYSKQLQLIIKSKFFKYFSVAHYAKSDEGGTGEARGQLSDKWSRLPSEEVCDIGSTDSGMFFFEICGRSMFLSTCVQLTIKHEWNIVCMWKFERTSQHRTQNVKTHIKTKHKFKKIRNTNPTRHSGMNSGAREG